MPALPRRTRHLIAVALLLTMTVLLEACGSSGDGPAANDAPANTGVVADDTQAVSGGRIVYGLEAESDGWNPSNSKWGPAGYEVSRAIFDTLTAYDNDLQIQPNLAESLTPNADYTVWTIRLRPDVRLHNGRPVDADLVRADMEYLKSSVLTSPAFEPIESFATVGPLDVQVNMKAPWVNYPYALATQIGVVADPDWLRSGDKSNPVGTGPFVFDQWIPDNKLVVRRNDDYWRSDAQGNRLPYLDGVEFRPIPDNDSRAASLQAGNIDIMQTATADQIKKFTELASEGDLQVFDDTRGETAEVFVQLNTMAPPFDDPNARRALALATDAQAYVDTLEAGLYETATGPFPTTSRWYVPTDYPKHDLAAAKKLVEQVKRAHDGQFSFKIIGPADAHGLAGVQLLQQQWKEAGIDATIDTTEQAQLITRVATGDYQATMWRQFDSPHPLGDSIWWHPNTAKPIGEIALNFARNKDEIIGQALDEARQTTDPAREKALYGEVQQRLAVDLPYIWLYHEQIAVIAASNLVNVVNYTLPGGQKGLELQDGTHPLFQIWLRG